MNHYIHQFTEGKALNEWLDSISLADSHSVLTQIFSGSSDLKKLGDIASLISDRVPHATIIGTTTGGEILNGEMFEESIVVSMSVFEKTALQSIHLRGEDSEALGREIAERIIGRDTRCIIMFADGLRCNGDAILRGLSGKCAGEIVVSGGMSGDNENFQNTYCLHGKEVFEGGVVAVALSNPGLEVFYAYNLSWKSIGKKMTITRSEGNIIYEIDHQPVKEIYEKYLGEIVIKHMPVSTIEFPLIAHENGIDIARSMVSLAPDGGIVYAGELPEGSEVHFGIGSPNMLMQNARQNYAKASAVPIEGLYVYSCVARKTFLGKSLEGEFHLLSTIAPLAGFFTYGEFYHGDGCNRLLNVSTTVLGLSESTEIQETVHRDRDGLQHPSLTICALMNLVEVTIRENEIYAQELLEANNALKLKDKALEDQKELYELVFKNATSGVLIIDIEANRFIDCNEQAVKILKCDSKDDVLNLQPAQLSPEYQPDGRRSDEKSDEMNALAVKNGSHTFEWVHLTKSREEIWIEVILTPITINNIKVLHVVWKDIADRKQTEAKLLEQKNLLAHMAHHDALTKLPNRVLFHDRLSMAIEKAKRSERPFALFFIDLDGFKQINDSQGHTVGDKVLQEASERLKTAIRSEDTLARLGGDEFIILIENVEKEEYISVLAQKILDLLSLPIRIDGHTLFVSASIGISLYPRDSIDPEKLLNYADAAMYKAKELGKNNFQYFLDY